MIARSGEGLDFPPVHGYRAAWGGGRGGGGGPRELGGEGGRGEAAAKRRTPPPSGRGEFLKNDSHGSIVPHVTDVFPPWKGVSMAPLEMVAGRHVIVEAWINLGSGGTF